MHSRSQAALLVRAKETLLASKLSFSSAYFIKKIEKMSNY